MSDILETLIETLQLERLDKHLFRGSTPRKSLPQVFGGQLIAQSMNAAIRTVPSDRNIHSLHASFLRPGDHKIPILFEVESVYDGTSFTNRRVVALQNGRTILHCSLSFQVSRSGFEHQAAMQGASRAAFSEREIDYLGRMRQNYTKDKLNDLGIFEAWEISRLPSEDPGSPYPATSSNSYWFRTRKELPDEPDLHFCLLAYISDYDLLCSSLLKHQLNVFTPGLQTSSLDHSLWFHTPPRVDEWILHSINSPRSIGGRSLCHGQFFSKDGLMLASSAQEGLIRYNGALS